MSIILYDDGSATYRGGSRDEVLAEAAYRVRSGDLADEKIATIRRWLASMLEAIAKEELEQQVEEEHGKRMKAGAREFKKLPPRLRTVVESVVHDSATKAIIERSSNKPE